MLRLSMNEMTTYRWSFEEDVAHYRAAGFTAMGVWRQKLSDYGEEKGIELLAESGLAASNLLWAGGFTGSDGRSHGESIDDALDAVRLARALSCPCLVVYSGGRAGHTHNHARRLLRDALKEVLPAAAAAQVALAIEPMHPACAAEWTFVTSLDDAVDLIGENGSPYLKLVLDTYHLGWDAGLQARIAEVTPHLAIVHLGDGKRPPDGDQDRTRLGEGSVPLASIVTALAAAGYRGYYDVELMGEEIAADCYDEILASTRVTCDRLLTD
jgi:sugar phosphate isomerase/epimerase